EQEGDRRRHSPSLRRQPTPPSPLIALRTTVQTPRTMEHAMTTMTPPADAAPAEAPLLLTTKAPRTLSFSDQSAFWANLGVSLIGFSSASIVLIPTGYSPLPVPATLLALALGTVAGMVM